MNELTINLQTKSKVPLYEQIYQYIKEDIQMKRLACGEKLPSTRALAKHLEVSRSTVELAYEQLLSEGYIEGVPCKGYFVAELEGIYQQKMWKKQSQPEVSEESGEYLYNFSPYGIDLQSFPYNTWRKLSKETLQDDRMELFRSGNSKGEVSLRNAIKNYLHQARGVNCSSHQIVVGAGNEYLLMLLSMILGDKRKIAFENPTYQQAYRVFQNMGYQVSSVEMDKNGICMEELKNSGADLAYVMPSHQYPMGVLMPVKRRLELLKWASEAEERYVIEDDYDSEFRYKGKPIPALQGYDGNDKVIYLGTFSRAIAPAIRISYMVLPEKLVEIYNQRCRFLSCTVPKVDQYIVQSFIEGKYFERHLNKMRAIYKGRHDALLVGLKPLMDVCNVCGEYAGVHLLLQFPEGVEEKNLIESAKKRRIKVYGLSEYYSDGTKPKTATIMLGFANIKESDIIKASEILCAVWKKEGAKDGN